MSFLLHCRQSLKFVRAVAKKKVKRCSQYRLKMLNAVGGIAKKFFFIKQILNRVKLNSKQASEAIQVNIKSM
jgi:hypothetical protein